MDALRGWPQVSHKEMYLSTARVDYPAQEDKPRVKKTVRDCLERHPAGCECWRTKV